MLNRPPSDQPLIDSYGRKVSYLRLSVTDRCDFRCTYCMSEDMTFLSRKDVLSLEEMERVCVAFIKRGVDKIRLTGGEPLVRREVITLIERLGERVKSGELRELTVTTNGSQLKKHAAALKNAGVKRINVSLDTLNEDKFRTLTRRGRLPQVLEGIDAALEAGLKVKLNAVAVKGVNDDEFLELVDFAHSRGMDITFIETMPLGAIEHNRDDYYLPLSAVKDILQSQYTFENSDLNTGGPSRYVTLKETGGRVGFITPLSHNFCESCNRVRVTCTGKLYMCLGQDDMVDLMPALRGCDDNSALHSALDHAMVMKPKGHDFVEERVNTPSVARHMNVTGG